MALKISIALNIIFLVYSLTTAFSVRMNNISNLEKIRENYEQGKYCESQEGIFKAADFDNSYYELIGKFYLKGHCVKFNINESIKFYKKGLQQNDTDVGKAIFLETLELIALPTIFPKEQIIVILNEIKKMGFKPKDRELADLKLDEFKSIFK